MSMRKSTAIDMPDHIKPRLDKDIPKELAEDMLKNNVIKSFYYKKKLLEYVERNLKEGNFITIKKEKDREYIKFTKKKYTFKDVIIFYRNNRTYINVTVVFTSNIYNISFDLNYSFGIKKENINNKEENKIKEK